MDFPRLRRTDGPQGNVEGACNKWLLSCRIFLTSFARLLNTTLLTDAGKDEEAREVEVCDDNGVGRLLNTTLLKGAWSDEAAN